MCRLAFTILIVSFFSGCNSSFCQVSFTGHSGVYYLGTANIPVPQSVFANPDISGVVVRFRWGDTETTPGNFNWAFVDGEIEKAVSANKKISLQPLGKPDWLKDIGVLTYSYTDKNTYHQTYGEILQDVITWDKIYIDRFKIFFQNLAAKYAGNTTVSYVNSIGGFFSRNLPDTVVVDTVTMERKTFWTAFPYNADTLARIMNKMTDYYMSLFPSTPLWCSVDYVKFEQRASGKPINYLASLYTNYGISNYPDRFGLFREDISGCNPPLPVAASSHWYIMQQNPCRAGAQMLWSVQDGPARMNKCGITPNTKSVVLDSAVNKALFLGMRYLEIYGADISDNTLTSSIQRANNLLRSEGTECISPTSVISASREQPGIRTFPNPAGNLLNVIIDAPVDEFSGLEIINSSGLVVIRDMISCRGEVNISSLTPGFYLIRVLIRGKVLTARFVKE